MHFLYIVFNQFFTYIFMD